MVDVVGSYEELEQHDKVATLDMGGTLVEDRENIPTHAKINMAMGMDSEEEEALYEEFVDEKGDLVDHVEHAKKQTQMLRSRPQANIEVYAETVQEIIQDREILQGAEYFVEKLHDKGYETVVVSSAPTAVTLPFAEDLDVDAVYRWKDFVFTEEGYFDKVYVNDEGRKGKHQIVQGLQELGVDVAHFGNGDNDRAAVDAADAGLRQWWISNPERAFESAFQEARKL